MDADNVKPATSSSTTVTGSATSVTGAYSLALLASTTMWLMVAVSGSASPSWAAATITICAVFQLLGVKVSLSWLPDVPVSVSSVTSELPLLVTRITTSEEGSELRPTP